MISSIFPFLGLKIKAENWPEGKKSPDLRAPSKSLLKYKVMTIMTPLPQKPLTNRKIVTRKKMTKNLWMKNI